MFRGSYFNRKNSSELAPGLQFLVFAFRNSGGASFLNIKLLYHSVFVVMCTLQDISNRIIEKAKLNSAILAGITSVVALEKSPSHKVWQNKELPADAKSVLVLALAHPEEKPELDWWDGGGGTAGNRRLINISKFLKQLLKEEFEINAHPLPYHVAKGGIYLKDSAVLAGLGIIGANNLLLTREFGPRVRLRAILLDQELESAKPIDFSPCDDCDMPCREACPQNVFSSNTFCRTSCMSQMRVDESDSTGFMKTEGKQAFLTGCIKYCRLCEFSCPVGKSC